MRKRLLDLVVRWRQPVALAVCYIAAGLLFVVGLQQVVLDPVVRQAVTACASGLLVIVLAWRFFEDTKGPAVSQALPLAISWAAGGAAILYGIVQVVPGHGAQLFVGFAGAGTLIAFLGWWLFSDVGLVGLRGRSPARQETPQERDTRWTRDTVLIFCYIGAAGVVLFAIRAVVPVGQPEAMLRSLAVGVLISCGSLLTGALLGFLFGIPRAQANPDASAPAPAPGAANAGAGGGRTPRPFQDNTNLEQISDWLTKIIVGLGLINLGQIPTYLGRVAEYFSKGFGPIEGSESITMALIVAFSVSGFLLGYLLTRLFLKAAFTRAESATEELKNLVEQAGGPSGGGPSASSPSPAADSGSASGAPAESTAAPAAANRDRLDASQIAAAMRISELATSVPRSAVRDQVLALAKEYNVTRAGTPFSSERTRMLDAVVSRMRVLASAASWLLPSLAAGSTPGERLAAIAILQIEPDAAYIPWLEGRFRGEHPFLKYHAAVALRNAAGSLPAGDSPALRHAVETGLARTRDDEAVQSILHETNEILRKTSPPEED